MWIVRLALRRPYTFVVLVEDNLAALRILEQEAMTQQAAVAAAQQALTTSNNRYKGGVATYLEVITSQNAALTNEAVAVNILGRRMADMVLLIEALGGSVGCVPTASDDGCLCRRRTGCAWLCKTAMTSPRFGCFTSWATGRFANDQTVVKALLAWAVPAFNSVIHNCHGRLTDFAARPINRSQRDREMFGIADVVNVARRGLEPSIPVGQKELNELIVGAGESLLGLHHFYSLQRDRAVMRVTAVAHQIS